MDGNGWISLHRKIQEHWLFTEERKFSKFEAWIDLLLLANYRDGKTMFQNELVEVKRGQHVTSIRKLCKRWGWSNTKVKNFLSLLESENMIAVQNDSKKTLITIVNYDFYQSDHKNDSRDTGKTLDFTGVSQTNAPEKRHSKIEKTPESHHKNDTQATGETLDFTWVPEMSEQGKRQQNDTETTQKHTNNNTNNYLFNDDEDNKDFPHFETEETEADPKLSEVKDHFSKRAQKIWFSPLEEQAMVDLIDKGIPVEIIKKGIDLAFERHKPRHSMDKINSFKYCVPIIYELYEAKKQGEDQNASRKVRSGENRTVIPFQKQQQPLEKPLPQVLRPDFKPPEPTRSVSVEEVKEKIKLLTQG